MARSSQQPRPRPRQSLRAVSPRILLRLTLLASLALVSLPTSAVADPPPVPPYALPSANNTHCTQAPLWTNSGPTDPSGTWASPAFPAAAAAAASAFLQGPCLEISGIGITETMYKTIVVIDRTDYRNSYMQAEGGAGGLAFAEELSLVSGKQRPLSLAGNAFCSTAAFTRSGALLNIGGANPGEGGFFVRSLTPCADGTCQFQFLGNITAWRWYPTSQLLGDGRVMVVGGCLFGADMNYKAINTPSVEYWPRGAGEGNFDLPFLHNTLPYNLYPFVHLLPSGRVFIFAADRYILFDTGANQPVGNEVILNKTDSTGSPIFRSYPVSGTSAMFPLRPDYPAEIMLCGGNSKRAKAHPGHAGDATVPADNKCYRIQPEADTPAWIEEQMQVPRVMPNAVLLPDGHVLIINGAQTGYSGIPNWAHQPALAPELYDTTYKTWYKGQLAASQIPRVYHGSALLLHDGSVFVSGSNPNSGIVSGKQDFPTEFRTEIFLPPYFSAPSYPKLLAAPYVLSLKQVFSVGFDVPEFSRAVEVVLCHSGFSTHGANHGMRNVVLKSHNVSGSGPYAISVSAPSSYNVVPPTWYWLFVVVAGTPSRDSHAVIIR